MMDGELSESAVKTVLYRKHGQQGPSGRVSVRTLKEMIAHWEIGPDDFIRVEGDPVEHRVREYPALSPLDEMLQDVSRKVLEVRRGGGRRTAVIRELQMLQEYAEQNDRVDSVASMLLGWLRYAENPALARGLFLRALERGYPVPSVARNNVAVTQIRLGDPAGRDNLIMAANDPQRPPAVLMNLARLLQHLQKLGERTEDIANVKDLLRVARAEWMKAPPTLGEPASYALFLCEGDIPASFASATRAVAKLQGQIEDILAEGEDCLRQGRLEQATAHAARAGSEIERARDELSRASPQQGISPLQFLSVRLSRLERAAQSARDTRETQSDLEVFRKRLRSIEDSLHLKVPPADLIQQAEILVDSSRTEGERAEALNILKQCQDRLAHHLLETAGELLQSGEKAVAVGLLRRALGLESRVTDEVKLRLAGIRREELEAEIASCLASGAYDEARARIALLRTVHPIFSPVADRLDAEVNSREGTALIERVAKICGTRSPPVDVLREARQLFEAARSLLPSPSGLGPIEEQLRAREAEKGITGTLFIGAAKPARSEETADPTARKSPHPEGFAIELGSVEDGDAPASKG